RLEAAVAEILIGEDRRQDVGLLVAYELAPHLAADADIHRRGRAARPLPLLLHQPPEPVDVNAQPALPRQLLGQLEREAVGVVEPERVVPRDALASRDLLEQAQTARKRLREALLLLAQHAAD